MIRTLIIEDELSNRNLLKRFIYDYTKGVSIIGEAATVSEGIQMINDQNPDLIFLDIQLKDGNGFEILQHFNDRPFLIVFLTGFKDYAIKAIKYIAFDYLLKPLIISELVDLIERAKLRITKDIKIRRLQKGSEQQSTMLVKSGNLYKVIELDRLYSLSTYGNYSKLKLKEGSNIISDENLSFHEKALPKVFLRVHKSYIINLSKVETFKISRTGVIVLKNGDSIPVSSRRKKQFLKQIPKYTKSVSSNC